MPENIVIHTCSLHKAVWTQFGELVDVVEGGVVSSSQPGRVHCFKQVTTRQQKSTQQEFALNVQHLREFWSQELKAQSV